MTSLDAVVLAWVANVLGCSEVTVLRGLGAGGSPWLLRGGDREVVLRVGQQAARASFATEVAALRLAADARIPVPRLLGHDDGTGTNVPLVLTERLPGSSQIPRDHHPARLQALGAAAARVHAVPLQPSAELPVRDRPIAVEDFAKMRRDQGTSGLLAEAEEFIARLRPANVRTVFVHGDLWHGNTLWSDPLRDGGILTGMVDWDCGGAGPPGVDLGSLRCDAALCHGTQAAADVLRGWESAAGRAADDVAYWDAVAALATSPDVAIFRDAISAQGRPDLDRATVLQRRDSFLRQALDHLQ